MAGPGPGFEPEDDPSRQFRGLVEQDPEVAARAGIPTVERQVREQRQAGRLEDGHPEEQERCPDWERQPILDHSGGAADEP